MPTLGEIFNGFAWNGEAWVVALLSGQAPPSSGGGDDLDTTPVAALGATFAQAIPNWLAGAPIFDVLDDVLINPAHRGAWVHMQNDVGSTIGLPDDWAPGMAFGARQIGSGPCVWQVFGGATMQLPFTKASHTGISEQYEEVVFRVVANVGGHAAVWGVSGGTI
jgi:hypothetical protein